MAEPRAVREFRKLPVQHRWVHDFKHPVHEVWPWVTNTDRLNRAMGRGAIDYRHEPDARGGSRRFGEMKALGLMLRWEEHPYEWILNQFFRVERDYSSGPLNAMDIHWQFIETADGCRIEQTVSYEPSAWVFEPLMALEIGRGVRKQFESAYRHVAEFLEKKGVADALPPFPPAKADPASMDPGQASRVMGKLTQAGVAEPLARRATEFVLTAQEPDLSRIRPFALAREWKAERAEVVSLFLRGTRAGLFALSWDLLCPSCRGAKERYGTLADASSGAHCGSCNIEYGVEFDQSVELTFRVSPAVREVKTADYCVGGPQNTPHYLAQLRLSPRQSSDLQLELEVGLYRIRSPQSPKPTLLTCTESAGTASVGGISVVLGSGDAQETVDRGTCVIRVENPLDYEAQVIVERVKWMEDACTAAYATSLQEFRDMFSSEVLRPGQEICVKSMALLFTDLKGSTSMYRRIGDATAFALVRDHFEILIDCVKRNEGGLVKTIGDAVMAAMQIHRDIEARNVEMGVAEKLKIKIGIHFGPCYAVNLNERLDYFGTTVNIAARTEGQCEGGDIVLTADTFNEPSVGDLVRSAGFETSPFVKTLKGFDEPIELFRIQCVR